MNNNSKILLLVSGILCIIFGIITISFFDIVIGIVLIIFSSKSEEELYPQKGLITGIGVILIVLNFISAILTFIAVYNIECNKDKTPSKINSPNKTKKEKKKIDPEIRKIDILLKLGVFMVLISGILFATTSWDYINNFIKIGFLLCLSIMFFFLSRFSEKKLKLENTTFAYYILGIAFLNFTWIAICYFKVISPFLSFEGPGKNLSISITFLLLGLSSYFIEKKYPKNYIIYFKYSCFYLAFYFLMLFMNIEFLIIISIITSITFIFNILLKDKNTLFKNFTNCISYILCIPLLYYIDYSMLYNYTSTPILYIIASILNIINLFYISIDNNSEINSFLVPIISNSLIINSICNYLFISIDKTIILSIILSIMFIILKLSKNRLSSLLINVNKVLYNIIIIPIIIYNLDVNHLLAFIISAIYLLINIANSIDNENSNKGIESILIPISIYLTMKSLEIYFINDLYINIGTSMAFIITSLIFFVIHITNNKEQVKTKYLYALLILSVLKFILNIVEIDTLVSLSTLLVFIYFYYNYKDNKDSAIVFILILYNIYQFLTQTNIFAGYNILSNILVIIIYSLIIYYKREDKIIKGITSLMVILPIYNLITETEPFTELHLISINLLELYILGLFVYYIVKNNETKNLLLTCGIILIMLQVIFNNSIFIALYVGIFGVLLALYGFLRKEYPYLFGLGIVITIVNIIYELREVWTKIPFWLYLLVFGLSIIGFVMNREVKKLDNKNNNKNKK